MKIKFNNCPECGGIIECKDVPIYGMGKYFYGKCTKCGLEGERERNKTLAVEGWNNGNIRYDEHEIKHRLISMCESEIARFNTENEINIKYVKKLKDMIRYFNR